MPGWARGFQQDGSYRSRGALEGSPVWSGDLQEPPLPKAHACRARGRTGLRWNGRPGADEVGQAGECVGAGHRRASQH